MHPARDAEHPNVILGAEARPCLVAILGAARIVDVEF